MNTCFLVNLYIEKLRVILVYRKIKYMRGHIWEFSRAYSFARDSLYSIYIYIIDVRIMQLSKLANWNVSGKFQQHSHDKSVSYNALCTCDET